MKKNAVLINAPTSFMEVHVGERKKTGEIFAYPPLGLLYLASTLEQRSISVSVIDAPSENLSVKEISHRIDETDPALIGISATSPQAKYAVTLAKEFRVRFPEAQIAVGGNHITLDRDFIKKYPYFDFCVAGEAEGIFPSLTEKVIAGEKLSGVFNGYPISDLDSIPFPARHLVKTEKYFMPIHGKRFTSILSSRGCPYNCWFCSRPVVGRLMRFRSATNVTDEMEQCANDFGIRWFQFVDDLFGINKTQAISLCKELKRLDVEWGCQTRVDLVEDDMLEAMSEAGCREISFGVETGSARLRHMIGKPFSDLKAVQVFKKCKEVGIKTTAFFILGFPNEERMDVEKTKTLAKLIEPDYIEVHLMTPFLGTKVYDVGIKEGVLKDGIWDRYIKGEIDLPIFVPPKLSKDHISQVQREMYTSFYFSPSYVLKTLRRDLWSPRKLWRDFVTFLVLLRTFS